MGFDIGAGAAALFGGAEAGADAGLGAAAIGSAEGLGAAGAGAAEAGAVGSIQSKFGQAISAVQPGPAEILKRKSCNFMIAATILKPRPRPLVCRVLSER